MRYHIGMNMTWQTYIKAVLDTGLTQSQLAQAIGCSQATISSIYLGKTPDPRCSVGLALMAIARKKRVKGKPYHNDLGRKK